MHCLECRHCGRRMMMWERAGAQAEAIRDKAGK